MATLEDGARDRRLRDLFDRAVELSPAEARALLDRECSTEPALRSLVEDLLSAQARAGSFQIEPGFDVAELLEGPPPSALGRWRIVGRLGRGGMGIVYRARHEEDAGTAAVKSVRLADPSFLAGIRREIHALSLVHHPGVVRILDQGVEEGVPWYAMELLEGPSLRQHALDGGSATEILTLVRRLCLTLSYLHGEGIVHRDLKPDNVVVRPDGTPVLLDFGLVTRFSGAVSRESIDAVVDPAGTLGYMAPEQGSSSAVDARADLYAVGRILAELADAPGVATLVERLTSPEPRCRLGHADDVAAALAALGADPSDPWPDAPRPRSYLYRPQLFGRDGTLREIARRRDALAAGTGGLMLIGGESGVGKTRLLLEAAREARAARVPLLLGECVPPTGGGATSAPLHPFRKVLAAVADRARIAGPEEAARLLGDRGAVLAPLDTSVAAALAARSARAASPPAPASVSLPPAERRRRIVSAVADTIAALASGNPTMLLIDDLQWADELSMEVLCHLAGSGWLDRSPVLVIATHRVEEPRPALSLLAREAAVANVEVGRLDADAIAAMVADMLAVEEASPAFVAFLHRHAEGNPFFVAEYLRAAIGLGLLARDGGGRWQLPASAPAEGSVPLPTTIRALVASRLEPLPPVARRVLELLAVLGREANAELLHRGSGLSEHERFEALTHLISAHAVDEPAAGLYRFVHDKIREVAYESISVERAPELHRAAAIALEGEPEAQRHRLLEPLGHHWELAGDVAKARNFYVAAARDLAGRQLLREAEPLYRRYLALGAGVAEDAQAQFELGSHVFSMGKLRDARADLEGALERARLLADVKLQGAILLRLARSHSDLGEAHAEDLFRQTLELARQSGDPWLEAEVLRQLAWIARHRDEELEELTRAIQAITGRIGDRRYEAGILSIRATREEERGNLPAALLLYRGALEALGEMPARYMLLVNIAGVVMELGPVDEAERCLEEALQGARRTQRIEDELTALASLGCLRSLLGRHRQAIACFEEALPGRRARGNARSLAIHLVQMADALLQAGEPERARSIAEEGRDVASSVERPLRAHALATLGDCALAEGRLDAAERLLEDALQEWSVAGNVRSQGDTLLSLARAAFARGDVARAAERASCASDLLRASGARVLLAGTLVLQAQVARQTGADAQAFVIEAEALVRSLRLPESSPVVRGLAELSSG